MDKMKIGLIAAAHIRIPAEHSAVSIVTECRELLGELGYETIMAGKIITDENEAGAFLSSLNRENIDVLVLMPTNWVEPPVLLRHLYKIKTPVVLWGFPETDENLDKGIFLGSSSAYAVIKSALTQMGVKHSCIMGLPGDLGTKKETERIFANIRASRFIAGSKIGLIGYNSMGIYTATFDQLGIKKHFGAEIDCSADSYIIAESMKTVTDIELEEAKIRFGDNYTVKREAERSFVLSLKMYCVLRRLALDGNWNALSVKCQHEFTHYLRCAACLPLSMLADDGVLCTDEGDVHAALTMLFIRSITDSVQFFGDIYPYNHKSFLMGHCGYVPHKCNEPGHPVILHEMGGLISKDGNTTGGIVSGITYRSGGVTLARLEGRRDGSYTMHIAEGYAKPARSVTNNVSNAEIILNDGYGYTEFLQNQLSNHYVMVYGKFGRQIRSLCEYLNVKII